MRLRRNEVNASVRESEASDRPLGLSLYSEGHIQR
jgi:hypothetical protein